MFVFQHKHLTVKEIFCGIVAVAGVVLVVTFQLLLKGCTIEAPKPTD